MSCASARRAPGRILTLLPRATRTPATSTWSVSGETEVSAPGSHQGCDGVPAAGNSDGSVNMGGAAGPGPALGGAAGSEPAEPGAPADLPGPGDRYRMAPCIRSSISG